MKISRVAVLIQDQKGLVRQLALAKEEGYQVLDFVRSLHEGEIRAFPEPLQGVTLEATFDKKVVDNEQDVSNNSEEKKE